jgi:uncharacterized protein YlbG (UPF0298 family)
MEKQIKELERQSCYIGKEIERLSKLGVTMFTGGTPQQRSRYSELYEDGDEIDSKILKLKMELYNKNNK